MIQGSKLEARMRFGQLVGAALVAAAAVAPGAALAGGSYHCPYKVVLYQGPGHHYHHVATAPAGATLRVYHCAGWCGVSWGAYRGWVQTRYISVGYPHVARNLMITPVHGNLDGAYVPTYVKPQVALPLVADDQRLRQAERAGLVL